MSQALRPCLNGSHKDFLVSVLQRMGEGPHSCKMIQNVARDSWPFKRKLSPQLVGAVLAGHPRVVHIAEKKNISQFVHTDHYQIQEV